jgi:predicted nucleic acid-binding protein
VKTLVLDSHPLILYFEQEEGWQEVAEILQQASEEKCRLLLSVVNWGEVYYVTMREYGEEYAEKVLHALRHMPVEIKEADEETTLEAAKLKARGGLSYADCFVAALAIKKKGELVTGDKEFKQVERFVKIRWI